MSEENEKEFADRFVTNRTYDRGEHQRDVQDARRYTEFEDRYVTNRDMHSYIGKFRWEMRALIAIAGLANMGLLIGIRPYVQALIDFLPF